MEVVVFRITVLYVETGHREVVAQAVGTVGILQLTAALDVRVDHVFHLPVPVLLQLLHHLQRYQPQRTAHVVHRITTLSVEIGHREVVAQAVGTVGILQLTVEVDARAVPVFQPHPHPRLQPRPVAALPHLLLLPLHQDLRYQLTEAVVHRTTTLFVAIILRGLVAPQTVTAEIRLLTVELGARVAPASQAHPHLLLLRLVLARSHLLRPPLRLAPRSRLTGAAGRKATAPYAEIFRRGLAALLVAIAETRLPTVELAARADRATQVSLHRP